MTSLVMSNDNMNCGENSDLWLCEAGSGVGDMKDI